MILKKILSFLVVSTVSGALYAVDTSTTKPARNEKEKAFLKKITPELMYSYLEFRFDSTQKLNFNRYHGFSNIYSVGADHIELNERTSLGLYYFRVDTQVTSQFSISPTPPTLANQNVNNNTLFAHILRGMGTKWYVDLAGAYGQNQVNTDYNLLAEPTGGPLAFAKNQTTSWLATANVIHFRSWKKFAIRMNVAGLYTATISKAYPLILNTRDIIAITPLTNQVVLIQESAEIGYPLTTKCSPFINGGLIQVAFFNNSRPLIFEPINGILPQLNLNKDGFRLGGGLTFQGKKMTLRIEGKYYNSGNTFRSTQAVASWEYRFG